MTQERLGTGTLGTSQDKTVKTQLRMIFSNAVTMRQSDSSNEHTHTDRIDDASDRSISLPDEVWAHVSLFLQDALSVCRGALVCKSLHRVTTLQSITEPSHVESLWKTLCDIRWKLAPIRKSGNPDQFFSYQIAFQRRHHLDGQVARIVHTSSLAMVKDDWSISTINELLGPLEFDDSTSEVLDGLIRCYWNSNQVASCEQTRDSAISESEIIVPVVVASRSGEVEQQRLETAQRGMSCILTDHFFFEHIHQQWEHLLRPVAPDENEGTLNVSMLQTGVTCLSHFLWDKTKLMTHLNNCHDGGLSAIEAQVCKFGSQLRTAMGDSANTTLSTVNTLLTLMYDSWGFKSNDRDYYNVSNSSVYSVLMETKKGNPISLVVIAKLILAQVHVTSHVIGLPGHVLLGVSDDIEEPTSNYYFDVYNGRRHPLTTTEPYMIPLTVRAILSRMLRNILHATHMADVVSPSVAGQQRIERGIRLLDVLASDRERLPSVRIMPLIFDPQIFE